MYIKITQAGPRRYLQIVEAYRDPATGKPRQRHIANLGRLDQLTEADLDGLIEGLLKVTERADLETLSHGIEARDTTFETALQLGDVWVLTQLWQQLKLAPAIGRSLKGRRYRIEVEKLVRVMVLNRLSDPGSKLGVLRWLETVWLPGIDPHKITHQALLRAMDALIAGKDALERQLANTLQRQCADAMEVVFYDITTVSVEGEGELDEDLRCYGYSKEGYGVDRQFAVGVVQTAGGLPVTHEVFEGNVAEAGTVRGIVQRLCARFPIRRLILVADRGMLSLDTLEVLEAMRRADGHPVEYLVAVPARRYTQLTAGLQTLHPQLVKTARERGEESVMEAPLAGGRRLVVAHDAERAKTVRGQRQRRLREVLALAQQLEAKLNAQEAGNGGRGRKLTDHGAKLQLQQAVVERHLSAFIQVDQNAELFSWWWDSQAFRQAWQRDGKLVLITNVNDLDATTVVSRYKALADIERGFRVMKSDLEIAPVHHRLPERIRAHTFLCFLALVLYRVMRQRLAKRQRLLSPRRLLEKLRAIQRHEIRLPTGKRLTGISRITAEHRALCDALEVEVPTEERLTAA
jgi:transposase